MGRGAAGLEESQTSVDRIRGLASPCLVAEEVAESRHGDEGVGEGEDEGEVLPCSEGGS
jgi:hypothetical protein